MQHILLRCLGIPNIELWAYRGLYVVFDGQCVLCTCEYRGSIYALFVFIHYPKYKYRMPNASPGITLGGLYSEG